MPMQDCLGQSLKAVAKAVCVERLPVTRHELFLFISASFVCQKQDARHLVCGCRGRWPTGWREEYALRSETAVGCPQPHAGHGASHPQLWHHHASSSAPRCYLIWTIRLLLRFHAASSALSGLLRAVRWRNLCGLRGSGAVGTELSCSEGSMPWCFACVCWLWLRSYGQQVKGRGKEAVRGQIGGWAWAGEGRQGGGGRRRAAGLPPFSPSGGAAEHRAQLHHQSTTATTDFPLLELAPRALALRCALAARCVLSCACRIGAIGTAVGLHVGTGRLHLYSSPSLEHRCTQLLTRRSIIRSTIFSSSAGLAVLLHVVRSACPRPAAAAGSALPTRGALGLQQYGHTGSSCSNLTARW